jgi:hypothetical protein
MRKIDGDVLLDRLWDKRNENEFTKHDGYANIGIDQAIEMLNDMLTKDVVSKRCEHPDGAIVRIGEHEVDPCLYEEIEKWENVTVVVCRCKKCGHVELEWHMQDNTERIF